MREIAAPILVLLGRLDFAVPYTVWQSLAAGLDHLALIVLEHDGHNPQTEAPERFDRALLEWFAAHTAAGQGQSQGQWLSFNPLQALYLQGR